MGKFIVTMVVGILILLIALQMNRMVISIYKKIPPETDKVPTVMKIDGFEPKTVVVTYQDSLYHLHHCGWIEGDSKFVYARDAARDLFKPCVHCFEIDQIEDR